MNHDADASAAWASTNVCLGRCVRYRVAATVEWVEPREKDAQP